MKVLFLNHHFNLDILAMQRARPRYEICTILPELFLNWTVPNIPAEKRSLGTEELGLEPQLDRAWQDFNDATLKQIREEFPFDVFVTPLDDTYYIRRFVR